MDALCARNIEINPEW
jgi:hypothetical protein